MEVIIIRCCDDPLRGFQMCNHSVWQRCAVSHDTNECGNDELDLALCVKGMSQEDQPVIKKIQSSALCVDVHSL